MADDLRDAVAKLFKQTGLSEGFAPQPEKPVATGPGFRAPSHEMPRGEARPLGTPRLVRSDKKCGVCGKRRLGRDRYCLACARFTPHEGEQTGFNQFNAAATAPSSAPKRGSWWADAPREGFTDIAKGGKK